MAGRMLDAAWIDNNTIIGEILMKFFPYWSLPMLVTSSTLCPRWLRWYMVLAVDPPVFWTWVGKDFRIFFVWISLSNFIPPYSSPLSLMKLTEVFDMRSVCLFKERKRSVRRAISPTYLLTRTRRNRWQFRIRSERRCSSLSSLTECPLFQWRRLK